MRRSANKKTIRTVELAMLVALVVVLQLVSAVIPSIGGVSITLTLVPVVVGAILFGMSGGAILGFSFGAIVLINCITGIDIGGNILWNANPFLTALICMIKGTAAGIAPALIYRFIRGNQDTLSNSRKYVAALSAALCAPIVNTGLFVCGMSLFFMDILRAWAGGSNLVSYVILYLVGINFIVEFLINIILTPTIIRIVEAVKNK